MILELVAEILSGETIATGSGPVDSLTAAAEDVELWGLWAPAADAEPAVELVGSAGVGAA